MAQYRSQWTGEVIDDAVGKAKNITYLTVGVDAEGAFAKAEAAYGASPLYATITRELNATENILLRCVAKVISGSTTDYRFRSFEANVYHTVECVLSKITSSGGSVYMWNGPSDIPITPQNVVAIYENEYDGKATHNIAKGQYVIWHDTLYVASDDIEVGDELYLYLNRTTRVDDGGLNDLKSALNGTIEEVSFPDGGQTKIARLMKIGRIVVMFMPALAGTTMAAWETKAYFSIPESFRPNTNIRYPIPMQFATTVSPVLFVVQSNGYIGLNNQSGDSAATAAAFATTLTWFTES